METINHEEWELTDQAAAKLRESWQNNEPLEIGLLLPDEGNEARRVVLIELIKLDQELSWKAGHRKLIAAYLEEWPELCSDEVALAELHEAELATRELLGLADKSGLYDSDLFALPCRFGKFELLERLGAGGMGVVWKARQSDPERVVALKIIRPEFSMAVASDRREELLARFTSEADAAAKLEHPNIVTVFEKGEIDGRPYLSMAYISGQPLSEIVKQRRMEPKEIAAVLIPVARAMQYAHDRDIVHRDLKPGNILLDQQNVPYVVDFGLAKFLHATRDLTQTNDILGTPPYMSPEQASPRPVGSSGDTWPASDVYSLGATLYEMLTGRAPFLAETTYSLIMLILTQDPPRPRSIRSNVPRGLELICLKCLEKIPERRYMSAGALADDLQRFLTGETLSVRPPSPMQKLVASMRRQPALAARLASMLLFYIVTLISWLGYSLVNSDFDWNGFHAHVAVLLPSWALASVFCQRLCDRDGWTTATGFLWSTLDSVFFLAILRETDGATSSLILCYPCLIVASGFWLRRSLVYYTMTLALVSYGILMIGYYSVPPHDSEGYQHERHAVTILALVLTATATAYHVRRTRILSGFSGNGR